MRQLQEASLDEDGPVTIEGFRRAGTLGLSCFQRIHIVLMEF